MSKERPCRPGFAPLSLPLLRFQKVIRCGKFSPNTGTEGRRKKKHNPFDKGGLKAAPCVSLWVDATASGLLRTLNGPPRFYLTPVTGEASRIVKQGRRNAGGFPLCLSLFFGRGEGELKQAWGPPLEESNRSRKSTRLNSSHSQRSRMPSSA